MKLCKIIVFLFLIASIVGCPILPREKGDNVEVTVKQDIFATTGEIPMLLIMADYSIGTHEFQSIDVYQDYYSNRFTYNAQDYFRQVSYENLSVPFKGVWGPYEIQIEEDTILSKRMEAAILALSRDRNMDLRQFDENNDNVLSTDELLIAVTGNGSLYGGAARTVDVQLDDGLRVRAAVAGHGSHANLATIVHELSHLLGTIDLYGTACNSVNLTLMSCTIFGRSGDDTVHLDPYHKMQLDWIEPRVYQINEVVSVAPDAGTDGTDGTDKKECYNVAAPQYDGNKDNVPQHSQRPILVFDAARNGKEYFLIEFRNASHTVPDYFSYEHNVPGYGVVIWTIRVDENGYPLSVPSINKEGGTDASIWTYGSERDAEFDFVSNQGIDLNANLIEPSTAISLYDRSSYMWDPGTVKPRYQDGILAGFSVEIGLFDENSSEVEVCISEEG